MSIICSKVIQDVIKCPFEIFIWLRKEILQVSSKAWFLLDSNGLVSLISNHKKYHFLLELLSNVVLLRKVIIPTYFTCKYTEITSFWKISYSAGQKFRTSNAMDFLWLPWERGANFADNHPPKMGQLQNSTINCPPLPKFTYLLQEG